MNFIIFLILSCASVTNPWSVFWEMQDGKNGNDSLWKSWQDCSEIMCMFFFFFFNFPTLQLHFSPTLCSVATWVSLNDIYWWSQEVSELFTSSLSSSLSSLLLALIPLITYIHLSVFPPPGCCAASNRDRRQMQKNRWKTCMSGCVFRQVYMFGEHSLFSIIYAFFSPLIRIVGWCLYIKLKTWT